MADALDSLLEDNILIISKGDTFIATTLQKKLRESGFEVNRAEPTVAAMSEFSDCTKVYIFYMDESSCQDLDTLVYLKDVSIEEEKMVILIGTPDEFHEATKVINKDNLAAHFLRPFDMNSLITKVHELTDVFEQENRKKCILIVDDDVTFLKMVHSWLKEKYRVAIVNSGMQAITWLAKNHADLVLLDYEMPVVDGPEILEMLKSESGTDNIPVFFLIGKSDKDSIQKAIGLRPDRYLLKSIGKSALMEELDKFFIAQKLKK